MPLKNPHAHLPPQPSFSFLFRFYWLTYVAHQKRDNYTDMLGGDGGHSECKVL